MNTVPGAQTVNEDTALSISGAHRVNDVDGNLATTQLTVVQRHAEGEPGGRGDDQRGRERQRDADPRRARRRRSTRPWRRLSYQGNLNFNGTDTLTVVSTDGNAVARHATRWRST